MDRFIKQFDQELRQQNFDGVVDWIVETAIAIQQIPAPTFNEKKRANFVADQFRILGLQEVRLDDVYNVYGLLPGANPSAPAMMLTAHTDTVFDADTDLTVRRAHKTIAGPGLGDNSMGVAGILSVVKLLKDVGYQLQRDLWVVATSREEGLGDLDGVRAAYTALKDRINSVINVEGLAFGHVYHAGIAVRRLKITALAEGGHSWLHYGRPSALHGIVQLGARITAIKPTASPRTTYNIGMIEGGQAINAIATSASLWLDMRSEDSKTLQELEDTVRGHIQDLQSDGLTFETEIVGDRPSGYIDPQHPLVRGALSALDCVGVQGRLEAGSTDGNIPLEDGCPTVTVGITTGGNAHRLDEYLDTSPIKAGVYQLVLLTLAADSFPEFQ